MKHSVLTALAAGSILAMTAMVAVPVSAQSGQIAVQLNGRPINLDPPPVERVGRVFVPLRGVFERMGASVVYDNGQINATGRGHTVSLNIGSSAASVDGQPQTLDVAPFIIGASTYVPLRFVSQSLGANVDWDQNNNLVVLTMSSDGRRADNGQRDGMGGPNPRAVGPVAEMLRNSSPRDGTNVSINRPTIAAEYSENVDPNSIRMNLDGVDVTEQASHSRTGIAFQPSSPLQPMTHHVQITGHDTNGQPFERSWKFTTGN
ncbi:MAG: stalk domain-containing protein [Vulcanimicrobiaceae bacterium]